MGVKVGRLLLLVAVAQLLPATAAAQNRLDSIDTPEGWCRVWVGIPGGSNFETDRTYSRCALDRAPTLLGDMALPAPTWDRRAGGSLLVVVAEDGTVDPRLTRPSIATGDSLYNRELLEAVKRWRFEPGMRGGVAVRSGFRLEIESDLGPDSVPAELEWTRRVGWTADTVQGVWRRLPALDTLGTAEQDDVYGRVLRRLVETQVVLPGSAVYCLVLESGDESDRARLTEAARAVLGQVGGFVAGAGCERSVDPLRIVYPAIHHTEGGRVVLWPEGDFLQGWPPGFEPTAYRTWRGKCVVLLGRDERGADCRIMPKDWGGDVFARLQRREETPADRGPVGLDSIRVAIEATTIDAFHTDTIIATVPAETTLGQRSVFDVGDGTCPTNSWQVYGRPGAEPSYVVKMDLDLTTPDRSSAWATAVVGRDPSTFRGRDCEDDERGRHGIAAFFLGDIGVRLTQPATLCVRSIECRRRYEVDPDRHRLAAHVSFGISDLAPAARVGEQLRFRVHTHRPIERGAVLVVIRDVGERPRAWMARPVGPRSWEYAVTFTGGYPPDTVVHVYLLRFPPIPDDRP